jgi:hypothetical protein
MNKALLIIFTVSILSGCSEEKKDSPRAYFSVPNFISQQARILRTSKSPLTRTVVFRDSAEKLTITDPDWEKELKPFADCDLNLTAWKNGFDVDTTKHDGTTIILYKAREKRIAIRELQLHLTGDSVSRISISYLKSNPWYSLGRTLTYTPGKGYTIIINQDTPLQAEESIRLEGFFQ